MAISALIGVMRISTGTPTLPIISLVTKSEDPLSIHTIALWGSRISRRLESRRFSPLRDAFRGEKNAGLSRHRQMTERWSVIAA